MVGRSFGESWMLAAEMTEASDGWRSLPYRYGSAPIGLKLRIDRHQTAINEHHEKINILL